MPAFLPKQIQVISPEIIPKYAETPERNSLYLPA